MKLEPVEYLAYVYYKCSYCGKTGDELRIRETKYGRHICMYCGNEDLIKPIERIEFNFGQQKESNRNACPVDLDKYSKVIKSITDLGWSKDEARKSVESVLESDPGVTIQELFRLAIIKLDEERTKTNKTN